MVFTRMAKSDRELILRYARANRLSLSAAIRQLLVQALGSHNLLPAEEKKSLGRLLTEAQEKPGKS